MNIDVMKELNNLKKLIEVNDANEEINHAKRHLHEVFGTLSDDEQRRAMFDTWLCTLNLKERDSTQVP